MWAQTAPLTPDPVVPKPFQFDASQYKLLLPNRPVNLKPQGPLVVANRILPNDKPCAVARIMKPNPAIDPQMIPHNAGPAPMPIEPHSRDIAAMNVPAPSCTDIAAPQELNAGPEKR